ncbi:MAG: hypothetical protein NTX48_05520 [Planctomycetales bacterium]|nr:hypothetical protein [Planctomycetales bacterium]
MIDPTLNDASVFEKANAAARALVPSVVELAKRTQTSIIVFRNGQIERIAPDAFIALDELKDDATGR